MTPRHSHRPYSSDDDFFDSGISPAQADSRSISQANQNSDHDDYSEDDDFDRRSNNHSRSPSEPSQRQSTHSRHSSSTRSKHGRHTPSQNPSPRQSTYSRHTPSIHSRHSNHSHRSIRSRSPGPRQSTYSRHTPSTHSQQSTRSQSPTPRQSTASAEQSVSSDSKSTRSTLTPLSKSRQSSSMRSFTELHSSVKKNYSVQGNIRKKTGASKASWTTPKYVEKQPKRSPVVQLMLASKQQEINDLLNKLTNTKQDLSSAEKENKLLKKLQTRHDKAIRRFENTRKELPEYLSTTSDDQRTLKLQLRKTQETKRSLESKLNQNFEEMKKMEGVLTRLKKLVYDKSLGERSELSQQLHETESDLEKAQQKIQDLDKKIESKLSNYTKQLNSERQKHQQTLKKLRKMEMNYLETNSTLKAKERALQKGNIYAFRSRDMSEVEKEILPLKASTPKLPLPAIPCSRSSKKAPPKLDRDKTSPDQKITNEEVTSRSYESKPSTRVFLTTDFDSPAPSPSNSFVVHSDSSPNQYESVKEDKENQFANDLKKTEEEIKKLQVSVEQKANLLAKLQEIDRTTPRNPEILKSAAVGENSFQQKSNSLHNTSSLSKHSRKAAPSNGMQNDKNDIFGGYSSSIQDSSERRRRPVQIKSVPQLRDDTDDDEPLFDLSSGKCNKKPDLLTQLFGKNDAK